MHLKPSVFLCTAGTDLLLTKQQVKGQPCINIPLDPAQTDGLIFPFFRQVRRSRQRCQLSVRAPIHVRRQIGLLMPSSKDRMQISCSLASFDQLKNGKLVCGVRTCICCVFVLWVFL